MSSEVKLSTLTMVKFPSRVEAPAESAIEMLPVPAVIEREPGPSSVVEKRMFPLPELSEVAPVSTTALPKRIWASAVAMLPADWVIPAPVCEKGPARDRAPPDPMAKVLATAIEAGPPAAVVSAPFTVKLFPAKEKPDAPLKETAPLSVVVPLPVAWLKARAEIAAAATLFALEINKVERGVLPPTAPVKEMLPRPDRRVRF